jgi:phenylpyruvate tautomerase PptA (4-oxalocrotonate tautomerase family)
MPFARIDLAQGKTPEYRGTVADVIYRGIVDVLKAPDLIIIQVTSTVGNTKEQKIAFFRQIADEPNRQLGVRREDVFISLVFVNREDWSFGNGEPW